MARILVALGLVLAATVIACGATKDREAEPPRLAVAYVDVAGDVVIRGEPDARSWRLSSDGTIFGMSWSPDAERLLVTERLGDDWQLRLFESGTFDQVGLVRVTERPGHQVTWRRDGAAFVLSGGDSAVAYSRDGRELWSIDRGGLPLGWSPDGRWFALTDVSPSRSSGLFVTDGTVTHEVPLADLGLTEGLPLLAGPWLADGTIPFYGVSVSDTRGWHVTVSDDGPEVGAPTDPRLAMDYLLASEARDDDGEAAREALVEAVGGAEGVRADGGGLHWVSARYDDADGHHRTFAVRDGAVLSDLRITIDFGDERFPQIVAVARPAGG